MARLLRRGGSPVGQGRAQGKAHDPAEVRRGSPLVTRVVPSPLATAPQFAPISENATRTVEQRYRKLPRAGSRPNTRGQGHRGKLSVGGGMEMSQKRRDRGARRGG